MNIPDMNEQELRDYIARKRIQQASCDDCGLNYCYCASGIENAEKRLHDMCIGSLRVVGVP